MKLVIQRVKNASVHIDQALYSSIEHGLLILLGIHPSDSQEDLEWLCKKTVQMRIFSDAKGQMNNDIRTVDGEILVVSQFTLMASTKKGNRPSYTQAARPEIAIPLYEQFVKYLSLCLGKPVQTGQFGAQMEVQLCNDGPVTILLDSQQKI